MFLCINTLQQMKESQRVSALFQSLLLLDFLTLVIILYKEN